MNNKTLLKQARKSLKKLIEENPTELTIETYPQVSDGFGGTVQDPTGTPTTETQKVRISHEKKGPVADEEKPSGLSTNLTWFILSDYETVITEGQQIKDFDGRDYRIGAVTQLMKFGGIYGYQSQLVEGNFT